MVDARPPPSLAIMDAFQREDDAAKWRRNNGIARVDQVLRDTRFLLPPPSESLGPSILGGGPGGGIGESVTMDGSSNVNSNASSTPVGGGVEGEAAAHGESQNDELKMEDRICPWFL